MSLTSATLISAGIGGGLGYLGYEFVGAKVAAPIGGGEYTAIFIGTGVAATVAPYVTAMLMGQQLPPMSYDPKTLAMNAAYGGAIGLGAFVIFNMVVGQGTFPTGTDVFISTALASVAAPYLTMKTSMA